MVYLTKKENVLFTNREAEIEQINKGVNLLKKGFPKNFSVLGLRKIGKTLLLKRTAETMKKEVIPVFFNIENNFSPPEDFALRFVYTIFYSIRQENNYLPLLSELVRIKPKSTTADEIINLFLSEYEKAKPNRLLLIQKAFEFPDKLAEELNIKFVLFLDEFQAINGLNNYREIKDVLGAIRTFFEHSENTMWIISGSAVSIMLNITSTPKSPFFELFININLDFFSKGNAMEHITKIEKMHHAKIDSMVAEKIFSFTRGHPFYIYCIADRLCSISSNPKIKDLTAAIFEEVLTPNARIYDHCKYVFDISLEKAKAKATIKRILEFLSGNDLLSMVDISKGIKMPIQSVNISLLRLMEVDMVERIEQQYRICDPVLRFWIRNMLLEGGDVVKIKEVRIKQIEQEILKVKTELGIAKEYEVREKLKDMFGIDFKQYRKGNIEFDAVGCKKGINYIAEIKWRNRMTDYKEIEKFVKKIEKSEFTKTKLFFIGTFTEQAKKFAEENKIEIIEI